MFCSLVHISALPQLCRFDKTSFLKKQLRNNTATKVEGQIASLRRLRGIKHLPFPQRIIKQTRDQLSKITSYHRDQSMSQSPNHQNQRLPTARTAANIDVPNHLVITKGYITHSVDRNKTSNRYL